MSESSVAGPNQSPAAWSLASSGYAHHMGQFAAFADEVLRRFPAKTGDRVLDVAAGPGTLTLPLARLSTSVVGVDFAPGMIDVLLHRARSEGLDAVEGRVMDAQSLAFPNAHFDRVYCLFGCMFFPDRAKAFAEMFRVLRPGGTVVIGTWGPIERRPMMRVGFDAMAEAMPGAPVPAKGDLQDPTECEAELRAAGFGGVACTPFVGTYRAESPEAYLAAITESAAPFQLMRQRLGEDGWNGLKGRLLSALAKRIGPAGASLDAEALFSVGSRPD